MKKIERFRTHITKQLDANATCTYCESICLSKDVDELEQQMDEAVEALVDEALEAEQIAKAEYGGRWKIH